METDLEAERESGYGPKWVTGLRSIRRQKHLSLQDAEEASDHEFKASVLGAYERGERAISVPRLQRLARFYNVPVDQLLPTDEEPGGRPSGDEGVVDLTERIRGARRDDRPVTIDLTAVETLGGQEGEMLGRYLRDDPGPAAGLQRPHAHHPPRRPAGHRLHPRHHPDQARSRLDSWASAWSAEPAIVTTAPPHWRT